MSLGGKKFERKISNETQRLSKEGKIPTQESRFLYELLSRIVKEILPHEVIVNNEFTAWFEKGQFDKEDLRHFLTQFSVFSNLFIIAQLKKTIIAPTLEAMHASKEILMNELGVSFRKPGLQGKVAATDTDPELVGTEGTIEGGSFHFAAAHFEWLLRMISHVDLTYSDIGKRRHGSKSTLFFVMSSATFGSDDAHEGLGASFSVENWAAAGFWKELVQGLET